LSPYSFPTMHQATRLLARVAAAGVLLTACGGGIAVRTSYDPLTRDLAPLYKTYSWLAVPAPPQPGDTTSPRDGPHAEEIRRLADEALTAKGYSLTDSAPDFRVGWHLTGEEPVEAATINMYYGYTWGRWFPGGGVVFDGGYRAEVPPRSLILDAVDGTARELVWRAQVELDPEDLADPRRREAGFREAIRRMLERFPPR